MRPMLGRIHAFDTHRTGVKRMAVQSANVTELPQLMGTKASSTPRMRVWRRFARHRLAMVSLGLLILISATVIAAPLVTPYSPIKSSRSMESAPNGEHFLGTDRLGRDIWT